MGQLLFFPRKQASPSKPNYWLGTLVFSCILAFCGLCWFGVANVVTYVANVLP